MTSFPTLCIHYYDTTRVMGRKVRPGRRPIIDSYIAEKLINLDPNFCSHVPVNCLLEL